jgi:alkanesulfonate monooxygenase SsuD/methylene tetrahydromethanopterin reductase-like flavin-dependent oxidoreductase (luciferase family)
VGDGAGRRLRLGVRIPEGGPDVRRSIDQAVLAEELGYDSVWLGEHHGYDTYWPSPHLVLAAIAARTERIRLGTNILLLPLADPVRLAGELALLDRISGGRAVLGAGIGWDAPEFAALGVDIRRRGALADGHLGLMARLWSERSVDHRDDDRVLDGFELSPRPERPLPVWIGGRSRAAVRRAARADAWFPDAALTVAEVAAGFAAVDEERALLGRPPAPDRPLVRHVILGETDAEASELAVEYLRVSHELHLARGNPMVRAASVGDHESRLADRYVVGTLERCVEDVRRLVAEAGVTELVVKFAGRVSGDDAVLQMRYFAASVHDGP